MTPQQKKIGLVKREDCPEGYYYFHNERTGRDWSVVDLGTMMASMPNIEKLRIAGMFLGWEAILIKLNGELDHESITRADTWKELEHQL